MLYTLHVWAPSRPERDSHVELQSFDLRRLIDAALTMFCQADVDAVWVYDERGRKCWAFQVDWVDHEPRSEKWEDEEECDLF